MPSCLHLFATNATTNWKMDVILPLKKVGATVAPTGRCSKRARLPFVDPFKSSFVTEATTNWNFELVPIVLLEVEWGSIVSLWNVELGPIVLLEVEVVSIVSLWCNVELGPIALLEVEVVSIVSLECNAARRDERRSPLLWRSTDSGICHSCCREFSFLDAFWSWNVTTLDTELRTEFDAIEAPSEPGGAASFVWVPIGTSVCSLVKSPFSGSISGSDCQVSICLSVYTCSFDDARTKSAQNGGIVAMPSWVEALFPTRSDFLS